MLKGRKHPISAPPPPNRHPSFLEGRASEELIDSSWQTGMKKGSCWGTPLRTRNTRWYSAAELPLFKPASQGPSYRCTLAHWTGRRGERRRGGNFPLMVPFLPGLVTEEGTWQVLAGRDSCWKFLRASLKKAQSCRGSELRNEKGKAML